MGKKVVSQWPNPGLSLFPKGVNRTLLSGANFPLGPQAESCHHLECLARRQGGTLIITSTRSLDPTLSGHSSLLEVALGEQAGGRQVHLGLDSAWELVDRLLRTRWDGFPINPQVSLNSSNTPNHREEKRRLGQILSHLSTAILPGSAGIGRCMCVGGCGGLWGQVCTAL